MLPDAVTAGSANAPFGYEIDIDERPCRIPRVFDVPALFYTSVDLDFKIVAMRRGLLITRIGSRVQLGHKWDTSNRSDTLIRTISCDDAIGFDSPRISIGIEMIEVLGLGVSRTGTTSLKAALETLGFGPCYHVSEVVKWPHVALCWQRYSDAGSEALSQALDGYRSACDIPVYVYWKAIVGRWPNARFILTIRDPQSWYESVRRTILPILLGVPLPTAPSHEFAHRLCRDVFMRDFMEGEVFSRSEAIRRYERHNEAVRDSLPKDRLLIMSMSDGWEPLCRFLGVEEPTTPIPYLNSSDDLLRFVPFLRIWQNESWRYSQ